MRTIELDRWPRRRQFELYRHFSSPHFNVCAPVDVTAFARKVKRAGASFSVTTVYVLAATANQIPEFRTRIRDQHVVEHDVVHPSVTILTEQQQFSFCCLPFHQDFPAFAAEADKRIAQAKAHPNLEDEPGRDDYLFMTSIPWVSFTSFAHPMHLSPPDCIPRMAWGKYYTEGKRLKMPLSVQGHHALMDGFHVGKYFELAQANFEAFDLSSFSQTA